MYVNVFVRGVGDLKPGRPPGWNPVRAERFRLCIYKFAERQLKDQEVNDRVEPIANICSDSTYIPAISSVKKLINHTISCEDGA